SVLAAEQLAQHVGHGTAVRDLYALLVRTCLPNVALGLRCRFRRLFAHGIVAPHSKGHFGHEAVIIALGEIFYVIGNAVQHGLEPFRIGLGALTLDVVGDEFLDAWMADADARAAIFFAAMRVHRTDAIVAASAAARLYPDLSGLEVEFIVQHDDIARRQLVEAHGFADRLAGRVHECLWLEKQDFL